MVTIRERTQASAVPAAADLSLPFDLRQRSRLLTRLSSGEDAGLMLERGTVLRGGDCLLTDDGRVVRVVAADEALMEGRCDDTDQLARCAFHLGNRHTPVEVRAGALRFAADEVLADMLRGLGAHVVAITAPFEPEAGAYAAGHHHSGEAKHAGIIHDMIERTRTKA
ncbi:MAG: urease accessory protein UreE [Casimicrobiaceae bacterium]